MFGLFSKRDKKSSNLAEKLDSVKDSIRAKMTPSAKQRVTIDFRSDFTDGTPPSLFDGGQPFIEEAKQFNNYTRTFRYIWHKGLKIKAHLHNNAEESIWITEGKLKICYYDDNFDVIDTFIISHDDSTQPLVIKKHVIHSIECVTTEAHFTARFDYISENNG